MDITAYTLAERWIGTKETQGLSSTPFILGMLRLDAEWVTDDQTAWCSAFLNFICWQLRLPRSKSLAARSWLLVGIPVPLDLARPGFDVVVLKRGGNNQPGPDVIKALGHVGLFAGVEASTVIVLGGNQSDAVSLERFSVKQVLGVRRLA